MDNDKKDRKRIKNIYKGMKQRCGNPNENAYKYYGARGIKICDEWLGERGFENFYNWSLLNGYSESLSIDRIDNDGNYSPDNCRWTDMRTQANNKRNNLRITYDGETHTLAEWSRIFNIDQDRLWNRYVVLGWSFEEAVTAPITMKNKRRSSREMTINGETKHIVEWLEDTGISYHIYCHRIKSGWSKEKAATTPPRKSGADSTLGNLITIDGETHNIGTWCRIKHLPIHIYRKRRREGMNSVDAITKEYSFDRYEHSLKNIAKTHNNPVMCVETGEIYKNCAEASREKGVSHTGIRNVICGFNKTCGGYTWRKVEKK